MRNDLRLQDDCIRHEDLVDLAFFFRHIPRAVRLALEQWRLNLSRILVNFGKSTAEAHILSPNAAVLGASG
jgi:hypothetical protein